MRQKLLFIFAILGMALGTYIPLLVGLEKELGPMGILSGFVGGMVGIWLATVVSKRYG